MALFAAVCRFMRLILLLLNTSAVEESDSIIDDGGRVVILKDTGCASFVSTVISFECVEGPDARPEAFPCLQP